MPAGAALLPADSCAAQAKSSMETDPTTTDIAMVTLEPTTTTAPAPDTADLADHAKLGVRLPPRPANASRHVRVVCALVRFLVTHRVCALAVVAGVIFIGVLVPASLLTHRPPGRPPFDAERLFVALPRADEEITLLAHGSCAHQALEQRFWRQLSDLKPQARGQQYLSSYRVHSIALHCSCARPPRASMCHTAIATARASP